MVLEKHLYPRGKSWRCIWNLLSRGTEFHQMLPHQHFGKEGMSSFSLFFFFKTQVYPCTMILTGPVAILNSSGVPLTNYMMLDSDGYEYTLNAYS